METSFLFQGLEIMWQKFLDYLPQVFWAILFFLGGWYFSKWIGRLVARFLSKTWLNQVLKRMGWEEALNRVDSHLNPSFFFGEIVRWCIFVFFLALCAEVLGLTGLTIFLGEVIAFLPNILIAAIIFIIAVFLAEFSEKIVIGTSEKEKTTYSRFLGKAFRWAIWFFAFLAIFYQLGITPPLILAILIGMIAAASIAIGISFGLGGKDLAKKILEDLKDRLS